MDNFNEILRAEEKKGWLDRPKRQMQGFHDAFDYCGLKDLGYSGFSFTWCNWKQRILNAWVRLDCGIASMDWILRFPTTRVHHLEAFHSDHRPIILVYDSQFKRFYYKGQLLRFEFMWLKDKSCENVIKDLWVSLLEPSPMRVLAEKNSLCQDKLRI